MKKKPVAKKAASNSDVPPDFKAIPAGLCDCAFVEIGPYDGKTYEIEGDMPMFIGPDGAVYARVCESVAELPKIGD